jgi:hypothetical protein
MNNESFGSSGIENEKTTESVISQYIELNTEVTDMLPMYQSQEKNPRWEKMNEIVSQIDEEDIKR